MQLSISKSKLDHIAELLEATRKLTWYFKRSYKHNRTLHNSTDSHHPIINHYIPTHSDKHKSKSHNTNDHFNEIIGQTHVSKNTKSEPKDIKDPHDSDSPDGNLDSSSHA